MMQPMERLRTLVTAAVLAGGGNVPEDVDVALEGFVWVGDLSGWEIVPVDLDGIAMAHPGLELRHRCGRRVQQLESGITGDGAAFLGNLVENAVEENDGHVCIKHEPSPEHKERVARWAAAAGAQPSGDVAQDQLSIVRALASGGAPAPGPQTGEEDDGEPIIRPLTGFDLYVANKYMPKLPDEETMLRRLFGDQATDQWLEQRRTVDGPGCTPAVVPGALAAFRDIACQTPSTGHGPEDYPEEPANIPVRRCIDGVWQTVEVTLSDFRANEGKPDIVTVECLGDDCTGCSDPQCWTARADGGDT